MERSREELEEELEEAKKKIEKLEKRKNIAMTFNTNDIEIKKVDLSAGSEKHTKLLEKIEKVQQGEYKELLVEKRRKSSEGTKSFLFKNEEDKNKFAEFIKNNNLNIRETLQNIIYFIINNEKQNG